MKKLLLTLVALVITATSFAQLIANKTDKRVTLGVDIFSDFQFLPKDNATNWDARGFNQGASWYTTIFASTESSTHTAPTPSSSATHTAVMRISNGPRSTPTTSTSPWSSASASTTNSRLVWASSSASCLWPKRNMWVPITPKAAPSPTRTASSSTRSTPTSRTWNATLIPSPYAPVGNGSAPLLPTNSTPSLRWATMRL